MRKLCLLLAVLLLLSLAGCGWNNIRIEDHTWVFLTANKDNDDTFLACSSDYAESMGDGLKHENIVIVDMECTAADGKLIFTDKTNDKTYEATYEFTNENRWSFQNNRSTIYGVTMDGDLGVASAYNDKPVRNSYRFDATEDRYVLTLMVGDYGATFVAQEHLEVS